MLGLDIDDDWRRSKSWLQIVENERTWYNLSNDDICTRKLSRCPCYKGSSEQDSIVRFELIFLATLGFVEFRTIFRNC